MIQVVLSFFLLLPLILSGCSTHDSRDPFSPNYKPGKVNPQTAEERRWFNALGTGRYNALSQIQIDHFPDEMTLGDLFFYAGVGQFPEYPIFVHYLRDGTQFDEIGLPPEDSFEKGFFVYMNWEKLGEVSYENIESIPIVCIATASEELPEDEYGKQMIIVWPKEQAGKPFKEVMNFERESEKAKP